jgi:hypothetical protein
MLNERPLPQAIIPAIGLNPYTCPRCFSGVDDDHYGCQRCAILSTAEALELRLTRLADAMQNGRLAHVETLLAFAIKNPLVGYKTIRVEN